MGLQPPIVSGIVSLFHQADNQGGYQRQGAGVNLAFSRVSPGAGVQSWLQGKALTF